MKRIHPLSSLFTLGTLSLLLLLLTQCSPKGTASDSQSHLAQTSPSISWEYGQRAYTHTEKILEFGPRPPQSEALKLVREYTTAELAKHQWVAVEQTFTANTPIGQRTFTNLIARYQPSGTPSHTTWARKPKGVLGAHIDSKYYPDQVFLGADDAASAVGAILEIAEYLHKFSPQMAKQLELVFFDGEEAFGDVFDLRTALFGSRHYSALVQRSYPTKPSFGIILDMIGHKDLSMILPSNSAEPLVKQTLQLAKELGIAEDYKRSGPVLDDHEPLNSIAGIPTIDILGDFTKKSWWHTPEDTLDIISKDSLSQNILLTLELIKLQLESHSP